MSNKETQRRLAEITDEGLFEELATAVLREADQRYRLLTHLGVNLQGKTIPGPVDGFGFVPGADPPHMITAQHTISSREKLKSKWLHGHPKGKQEQQRKTATQPGDLVKTAELFEEYRQSIPDLQATLILTTNKEPSASLQSEVTAAGKEVGLDVVIWSRSSIAHFLDHDATGQWIRSKYLGIAQERLSEELLRDLSQRSLKNSYLLDNSELWIDRQLDQTLENTVSRDLVFVAGESGLGKSVACHKRLNAHIEAGGFGLIVPHEVVATTSSLEQAIDATLKQLHPSLASDAGSEACAKSSERMPLLMVVEDINKSGQPALLIEKLMQWYSSQIDQKQIGNWQILCPVWPKTLSSLGHEARNKIDELVLTASSFTTEEGFAAVQRRCELVDTPVTKLEAETVASALGHDPLLISLQDPGVAPDPEHVIRKFIEGSLERLSGSRGEFTAGEYQETLRHFATEMLKRRCLEPVMADVTSWFKNTPDTTKMLRHIIQFGEVVRIVGSTSNEQIEFRHDRVRDWLHVDAVANLLRRNAVPGEVLAEPYYAEIIGAALVREDIPVGTVEKVKEDNPLALFYAMRVFGEPTNNLHRAILEATEAWLDRDSTHSAQNDDLRWNTLRVLSEIDASYVTSLVQSFRNDKDDWWGLRARFRNGDFVAGIKLCCLYEPGTTVIGHLELIEHVQQRFPSGLIRALERFLRNDQLTHVGRSGALRLAGHLGNPKLADEIMTAWLSDGSRIERLADYLWASARCCGDSVANLLVSVCDSWAMLSDQPEQGRSSSPRNRLAAYNIRWAFRDKLPESAIRYFIERAISPELRWPITYMLSGVDHPEAVEFVVRELAETDERLEQTGDTSIFGIMAGDEWKGLQERTGRAMSEASRNRLHQIWSEKHHGKHLRSRAFQIWCSTTAKGDILALRAVCAGDELSDKALFQRLRRRDAEAIPGLVEKLQQDAGSYWWQAGRYIWSDDLTDSLDKALHQRGETVKRSWDYDNTSDIDWILAERLMELHTGKSAQLLIQHWENLRFLPHFVQAALYTADPRLADLVGQTIDECLDPKSMFEYLGSNFGIRTIGRKGITRIEQVQVLSLYFDYLRELDILELWETCNTHGWLEFRRQHLDARVKSTNYDMCIDDNRAMAELDNIIGQVHGLWARNWAERFLKTAITTDHMMNVLETWLSRQTDIKALELVAAIVTQFGKRHHISILSSHNIDSENKIQPIIANADFALRRRSLN